MQVTVFGAGCCWRKLCKYIAIKNFAIRVVCLDIKGKKGGFFC